MIVHMIGNAHIDPVWLWGWQAGVDEALATFHAAADRCDEYPEFIFTRGEAWLYQQIERIDPDLFARVKTLVDRGRWHITGGQYLQPDINLPTEMSLERQIIHGQRYFQSRFGVRPRIGYNVDSFGHTATLPDILTKHGYIGYIFHRPHPQQVPLPAQTFRWRGIMGGELIGFRIIPVYISRTDDLYGQIMLAAEAADPELGHTMCFYGVGNHGGGPTKKNIEYILEHHQAFDGLELRFSTPQAFFEAVLPKRAKLPVVDKELQRTFPGCYSVMHDIKQAQRHGEHMLDLCERVVETFEADEVERESFHKRLDKAWDDLLFTAFHDILAGTSIPSAWTSVRAMQGRASITAEEIVVEVTRRWAHQTLPRAGHQQLIVLNTDVQTWRGFVEAEPWLDFDAWGSRWMSDMGGHPIDFQLVQPEAQQLVSRVLFPAKIPGGGGLQLLIRGDPLPEQPAIETDLMVAPDALSNRHLDVKLDAGGIKQLHFRGRPLLGTGGLGLHLRQDHSDTWTFHADRFDEPIDTAFQGEGWVVEEAGPLRVRVRTEGRLGASHLRWTLSVCRDDPRLFMKLEITFAERFKLLQLPIHLVTPVASRTDGLAAGQVERRTEETEWPVQGWSRVDVGNVQLALVTQDAYSLSLNGDLWQWTLLRSPKMAWGGGQPQVYAGRDWYTDQGVHTFDFQLLLDDELTTNQLATAARQSGRPLIIFDRFEGANRPPWGDNPPRGLWTPAERRALADGKMTHLLARAEADETQGLFTREGEEDDAY